MNYDKKWFYDQGKNEGLFGIRLLDMHGETEENNHSFIMGYTEGSIKRAEQTEEEKKLTKLGRPEYIRSIGIAVSSLDYPASDKHLNEEEKKVFEEGKQAGLSKSNRTR